MNAQLYLAGVVSDRALKLNALQAAHFKKHELACKAKSDEKYQAIYKIELARLAAEAKLLGIIPAGKICASNMKRWAGDLEQHAFFLDGVIKGLSHAELGQYLERHVGYAEIPFDSDAGVLALDAAWEVKAAVIAAGWPEQYGQILRQYGHFHLQ